MATFFLMQAALATSVDLRCYLVLSQTVDGAVTLDLADFGHHMKCSLSALTHCPESNGAVIRILELSTAPITDSIYIPPSESQMVYLKELSGSLTDSPPTLNVATLVFLYLLTHICREKLRCMHTHINF